MYVAGKNPSSKSGMIPTYHLQTLERPTPPAPRPTAPMSHFSAPASTTYMSANTRSRGSSQANDLPPLTFSPNSTSTLNAFTVLAPWQALGFADPHAAVKRSGAYVETRIVATSVVRKWAAQPWTGGEVFKECHRPVERGETVFGLGVGERRRGTQLLGFGEKDLPLLKMSDELGMSGHRAGCGGRRGRGAFRRGVVETAVTRDATLLMEHSAHVAT